MSKFEIKAGIKPIEDLYQIPVRLIKEGQVDNTMIFNILVSDMKVNLTFEKMSSENTSMVEDTLNFMSSHLKNIYHSINEISFLESLDSRDKCSIFCKADRNLKQPELRYRGVSSNFIDYYSLLELLIVFSQMAEMLVYHVDNMDRRNSENLWMKHVVAELRSPIKAEEINLIGKIRKNKLLNMRGKDWKIFEMSGKDTQDRINISCKVAHQLPEEGVIYNA